MFDKRSTLFERGTDKLSVCKQWLSVFKGREFDRGIKRRVDFGWDDRLLSTCIDVWRHWSTLRRVEVAWLEAKKNNLLYSCQSHIFNRQKRWCLFNFLFLKRI